MPRSCVSAASIALCACLSFPPSARAEPVRAALVMGNAIHGTLPVLTACARSGNVVAAALQRLGFEITKREDASTGAIDGGIGEFSRRIATGSNIAFIYVCGYGVSFNDRVFLLPVNANLTRPSDVLTQGVLVKTLLNAVSRDSVTTAVIALDLMTAPNASLAGAEALAALPAPDGVGLIAVTAPPPVNDGPTPLAEALVAALAGPAVRGDTLLTGVRTRLTGLNVTVAALRQPARPEPLAGAPPPPAPPPVSPAPPSPVVAPVVVSPPVASPPVASPPAPVAEPVKPPPPAPVTLVKIPDEGQMTELDRRKVQGALLRLNLYDRPVPPVNGKFGPETRTAIRRYQLILGTEMTGRLTSVEASKLVSVP